MSRQFQMEFIQMFKDEPCLWQVNSKYYHDRDRKEAAYAKLVDKFQEVYPNTTKEDVIKKIYNMRSAIRKEKKKIKLSLKSGASGDSVYKPKLWYYSLLSFLFDQDIPRTSRSNKDSGDDSENEKMKSETNVPKVQEMIVQPHHQPTNHSAPPTPQKPLRKRAEKKDSEELENEIMAWGSDCFKKPRTEEDRFDVIGKAFAIKLRGLPKEQMLLAEKIMNEALFHAEMGTLTMAHRVVGEPYPERLSMYMSYGCSPEGGSSPVSCPSPANDRKPLGSCTPASDSTQSGVSTK